MGKLLREAGKALRAAKQARRVIGNEVHACALVLKAWAAVFLNALLED